MAIAAAAGAVLLGGAGFAVSQQLNGSPATAAETVTTVTAPIPPCTAVTGFGGQIADPCNAFTATWEQSNRNALGTMAYYPKWKAANPNEYQRLRAWSTSGIQTPEPVANSAFGALVRYHLTICRTWTLDLARCLIP